MNKKETERLEKQLDRIVDHMLIDGWKACNEITNGIYLQLLKQLKKKIDEDIVRLEEKNQ